MSKGIKDSLCIIDVLDYFTLAELLNLQLLSKKFYHRYVPLVCKPDLKLWYPKEALLIFPGDRIFKLKGN